MLIDLRTLPQHSDIETDCCIIGAGAAGITLARTLARAGVETCLLESGGLAFEPEIQSLGDIAPSDDPRSDGSASPCRLRFFGGATNHRGGWCAPLGPQDLAVRPWVRASGWPIDWRSLETWYPEAQRICQLGPYGAMPTDEPDTRPERRPPPLLPAKLQVRYWQYSPPTRFGKVYRDELTASDRVRVFLHANCTGLNTDPGATRVLSASIRNPDGSRARVRARRFVLACGALDNARLLLVSSRTSPNGLGNDNGLVGRYFMQHPEVDTATLLVHDWPALARVFERFRTAGYSTRAGVFLTAEAQRTNQSLAWAATLHVRGQPDPDYDAVSAAPAEPTPDERALADAIGILSSITDRAVGGERPGEVRVRSCCEQAPNPDSRIRLSTERDALGLPRPEVHWKLDGLDRHSVTRANRLLAEEIGRLGIGRLRLDPWLTTSDWHWPDNLWGGCHHMGTTRMSESRRDGVVDGNCRVHGVSNLFVAGSSVFTTGGCANPTLTIVALALRLADHLAKTGPD